MKRYAPLLNAALLLLFCCTKTARCQTPLPPGTTQEAQVNPIGLLRPPPYGWHTGFLGPFRGVFDASIGVKVWPTRFQLDNFVFGGTLDILPGIRARLGFRRREGSRLLKIDLDEFYLEAYDNYRGKTLDGAVSLRFGHVRYLHVPYPDAIAIFDPQFGNQDQYSPVVTDYRTLLLEGDVALHNGLGAHWTGRTADPGGSEGLHAMVLDAYAYYRLNFNPGWHFELHAGDLAVREFSQLRPGQPGVNVYLGKQLGEFNVGLFYEHKSAEPDFTGISVQFRPTRITRFLGKYTVDYSRHPDGFTAQIPLLHYRLNEHTRPPSNGVLVGQIRAVRIRTVDANGFERNQYEHRLEQWGQTGRHGLICVVKSDPWYLQAEALYSPHTSLDSRWLHDRAGPGQYAQRVTYSYYRLRKKSTRAKS